MLKIVVIGTNEETRIPMIKVLECKKFSSVTRKIITQRLTVQKSIRNPEIKNNISEVMTIIPKLANPVNQSSLTSEG